MMPGIEHPGRDPGNPVMQHDCALGIVFALSPDRLVEQQPRKNLLIGHRNKQQIATRIYVNKETMIERREFVLADMAPTIERVDDNGIFLPDLYEDMTRSVENMGDPPRPPGHRDVEDGKTDRQTAPATTASSRARQR